jgi:DNA repair ATPase RecN
MAHMEQAYTEINIDVGNLSENISEKVNKIIQAEKDLEQLQEKIERASRQLINYSRELRRARNTENSTLEERDFKLRDLWDFNRNKAKELVEISRQYPLIQQTLNLLFNQVNRTFLFVCY